MNNIKVTFGSSTILITALLCILKVTGIVNISWWWCFCLIWLPFVILFVLLFAFALIALIFYIIFITNELITNR